MGIERFTHLGRPVDPAYPTNAAIAALSVATLIAVSLWQLLYLDSGFMAGLIQGGQLAGVVFLTWALGREVDPDASIVAFLAIAPAVVLSVLVGAPDFSLLFLALLLLRVVNRSIGLPAKRSDSLLVLALASWLAWSGVWYGLMFTAVAFLLDSVLVNPLPHHRWFGLAAAVAAVWSQPRFLGVSQAWPGFVTGMVAAGGLGLLLLLLFTPFPRSVGDLLAVPVNWKRLQAARIVGFFLALFAVLSQGMQGLVQLSPVLAVIAVAGCYRLIIWLKS
ncbi:MAG: hypothetical protein EOL98_00150 [Negativicutes bacterium]|nr:hypothetical protein [Negativicutes bacterium]